MPCKYGTDEDPCQFEVPEDRLVVMEDGSKVCVFHLPAGNALGNPVSRMRKAQWTQAEIDEFNQHLIEIIQAYVAEEAILNLKGVTFPGDIYFGRFIESKTVLRRASFEKTFFAGKANFDGTHFYTSRFDSAVFRGEASFRKTIFEQSCEFSRAVFDGFADFSNARFSGNSVFTDSRFSRGALWEDATFSGAFIFHCINREFSIVADFSGCRFDSSVCFRNRRLLSGTSFADTVFFGLPDFFDCAIHADVDFSTAKFKYSGAEARLAYEELRRKMEDRRDRVQQGVFHAMEKRCERRTLHWLSFEKLFSWLYDATSAYGISTVRPLVWLGALTLFSAGVYTKLFHAADPELFTTVWINDWASSLAVVVSFSIEQMLQPFTIWSGKYQPIDSIIHSALFEYPLVLRLMAAIQSLFSFGLIAAFLISVRWRFRRA